MRGYSDDLGSDPAYCDGISQAICPKCHCWVDVRDLVLVPGVGQICDRCEERDSLEHAEQEITAALTDFELAIDAAVGSVTAVRLFQRIKRIETDVQRVSDLAAKRVNQAE